MLRTPQASTAIRRAPMRAPGISRRRLVRGLAGTASAGLVPLARGRPAGAQIRHSADAHSSPEAIEQMESLLSPDGTRIAYQRVGSGPPLVLVHGTADDHSRWAPVLPTLEERFTVYALDRRGRGGSGETSTGTYSIEREFADVASVVDAIDEPVHLLGHSYGALCSLEAALRTGNLRALVLYEPPFLPPGGAGALQGPLEEMERLLAAGNREGVALIFARQIAQVPEDELAAVRSSPAWQVVLAVAPTIVDEVRAVGGYVFDPNRFRELTTPTLLLMGSETAPFLKAATETVAAALPHSRLFVLTGQGHLAIDTAPDLFLGAVLPFLTDEASAT
jgi:pimeloyl-ACP methyl ester carboxylesterase